MRCNNCGQEIFSGNFCNNCGSRVNYNSVTRTVYRKPDDPGVGNGIASMILGIVSLSSFVLYGWVYGAGFLVSFICSIIGLALGCAGKKASASVGLKNGKASAGITMSLIPLIIMGVFLALILLVIIIFIIYIVVMFLISPFASAI